MYVFFWGLFFLIGEFNICFFICVWIVKESKLKKNIVIVNDGVLCKEELMFLYIEVKVCSIIFW